MIFIIAILIIVIAYFWQKNINQKKNIKAYEKSDASVKALGEKGSSFITFNGDDYSLAFMQAKETTHHIKNEIFVVQDNGLYIPNLKKGSILKLNDTPSEEMQNYITKHSGIIAVSAVPLELNKKQATTLGLPNKHTILVITPEKFSIFANDPNLNYWRLTNVDFLPKYSTTTNTTSKGRSGSAIVGGLIAGPVGAIAGGSRKKYSSSTSETKEVLSTAHLSLIDNSGKKTIVNAKINSAIANILSEYFLYENSSKDSDGSLAVSDADELSKFKKLLDEGVVTQEEFDMKKKQILGL